MSMINRQLRTTADKRLRYASPKLPSATSFIRKTLGDIQLEKDLYYETGRIKEACCTARK